MKKLLSTVLLAGALFANPSGTFDKNVGLSKSDLVALKQDCVQMYQSGLTYESASKLKTGSRMLEERELIVARSSNAFLASGVCFKLYEILKEEFDDVKKVSK